MSVCANDELHFSRFDHTNRALSVRRATSLQRVRLYRFCGIGLYRKVQISKPGSSVSRFLSIQEVGGPFPEGNVDCVAKTEKSYATWPSSDPQGEKFSHRSQRL